MTLTRCRIVLAASILLMVAESAGAQQREATTTAVIGSPTSPRFDRPPTDFELAANSVGMATGGALIAGGVGFAIDDIYCERHHGKEPSFLFGPCFLYAGAGSIIGWFGGTVVGATLGAARTAEQRGCPHGAAVTRSVLGAAIGVAPSILVLAPRGGRYARWRAMFTIGAPALTGLGAALAVRGCRRA